MKTSCQISRGGGLGCRPPPPGQALHRARPPGPHSLAPGARSHGAGDADLASVFSSAKGAWRSWCQQGSGPMGLEDSVSPGCSPPVPVGLADPVP